MPTTPAKSSRPSRPAAKAPTVPDLAGLEQFIMDTTETRQAAVARDTVVRERFVTELRVLESERQALGERRSLAERLFKALTQVFDAEEADIDAAIGRYRNALLDGAETQERTAA